MTRLIIPTKRPLLTTISSPTFLPNAISGLVVWVKADDLLLANGAAVTVITNNGNTGSITEFVQATEAAQPSFQVGLQNNRSAIRFDGGDSLDSDANTGLSGDFTASMFVVAKINTLGVIDFLFSIGASTTLNGFSLKIDNPSSVFAANFDAATNDFNSDITTDTTDVKLLTVTKSVGAIDSTTTVFLNGVAGSDAGSSSSNTPDLTDGIATIGALVTGSAGVIADIYEVLLYNSVLSTVNQQSVERYLVDKYNVSP